MRKKIDCRHLRKTIKHQSISIHIGRTQLLFANGIEGGIQDRQVMKYQPSVKSIMIFHHLIQLVIIEF